ncbi:transcriptional coactivator/pterin dehydratase [Coniochaeta ligniaria NRRL 30616]|uniref:4a-hydroxytetrahydrobiopterin dehydratase n=1 Tax=Coniochaeta ligniaria NRRL 30616 TaxID=1408157 RepID=A0A1J7JR37_9PEZI|nr:transcriptional coactivator/pterin dehydratase [Coniochaeta ligniaria NRRL 30616]
MPPRISVPSCGPSTAIKNILAIGSGRPSIRSYMTKPMEPSFSKGAGDVNALRDRLDPLLSTNGGRWALANEGEALERTFKFKTFAKTWDFMTAVSLQCKIKNHHPEWSNVFNTTFIRWTTHNPKGLSDKDVDLAATCDSLAKDFGEVEEPAGASCEMKGLADRVAASAGDCCTPKSAKQ